MLIDELVDDILYEHSVKKTSSTITHEDLEYKNYMIKFYEEYNSTTKEKDIENIYKITTHPNFLFIPCPYSNNIFYRLYGNELYCIDSDELNKLEFKNNTDVFKYTIINKYGHYYGYSHYRTNMMYHLNPKNSDYKDVLYENKIFMGSLIYCKKIYKELLPSWRVV